MQIGLDLPSHLFVQKKFFFKVFLEMNENNKGVFIRPCHCLGLQLIFFMEGGGGLKYKLHMPYTNPEKFSPIVTTFRAATEIFPSSPGNFPHV